MVMANTDAEFDAADLAVWTEMARRILKGAAPDSLDRIDEDALVTAALYPVHMPDQHAAPAHLLPAFPHRRLVEGCLLYTSPSPRDVEESRMPSSA